MPPEDAKPLILTLTLEPALADPLNDLRKQHFPPERNFLDAHVTLFHALPGEHEAAIRQGLEALCAATPAFEVRVPRIRRWGKGVFAELASPGLLGFREALAARWADLLTPQDRRPFKPHVTVQNKVPESEAQALYAVLEPTWKPLSGSATGAALWYYAGGPWEASASFSFLSHLSGTLGLAQKPLRNG